VEAGQHYPSDVLAGMVIGNFFGILFDEALLSGGSRHRLAVSVTPAKGGGEATWRVAF
jgi:membrane-associated phospholipid phosphatase